MHFLKMKIIWIILCLFSLLEVVYSAELTRFFGHSITIEGEYPERTLKIDGRAVHSDAILVIDEVAVVSGVPVAIGNSSNGGNACDGSPFVVSFPPSGKPRFDGPIETCFSTTYEIAKSEISFTTNNVPGKGAERWIWTPADGLKKLASEKFAPKTDTGWNDLRERAIDHPSDIFKNAEIADQIAKLLGPQLPEFQNIITGTGSGRFKGDDFVGSACTAHMCGDEEAMVFLDSEDRLAFVAWKPYQKKIVVFPPIKQWPEKARLELKIWAEKWK